MRRVVKATIWLWLISSSLELNGQHADALSQDSGGELIEKYK